MFIMLIGKTCPRFYEIILNSYKDLRSKDEWLLLFSDDLVISSRLKYREIHYNKGNKKMGVNRLNPVQKATYF